MSNPVQKVSAYLTGHSLEQVSYDDLKKFADEHPYFGIAQFLLAKKMKEEGNQAHLQQAQKAALYFSDYYLLDANLSQPLAPWNAHPANTSGIQHEQNFETIFAAGQNTLANENKAEAEATDNSEADKTPADEAIIDDFTIPPVALHSESEAEPSSANVEEATGAKSALILEPDEHEKMFENIKAMLDANAEEANADVKDAPLLIDPYYTIDYFASQGIKLHLDPNPQDNLGKNLKKFTQWLKHMKKLGPEDAMKSMVSAESEAKIQRIADTSNTAKQVVTEAMATVLEKQGKIEKAIELYNKLSFLNPDKSPYFAARIQSLKEQQ